MNTPTSRTSIRLIQQRSAQAPLRAPAPAERPAQSHDLGQDFKLLEGRTDKEGRYLEVVSTVSGKNIACPHLLRTYLNNDFTGNRFYINDSHNVRATIAALRKMTCYREDMKSQGVVVQLPAVARIA